MPGDILAALVITSDRFLSDRTMPVSKYREFLSNWVKEAEGIHLEILAAMFTASAHRVIGGNYGKEGVEV